MKKFSIFLILTILCIISSAYSQQEREPPPAFFLTDKDKVYIILGKISPQTEGFKVYKKIPDRKEWQLLTPEPVKPIRDCYEFRNFIGERLYSWLKKATKGDDEFQVLRRILRDRGMIAALSVSNLRLAEALGRLYIDKEVKYGKEYIYKIIFIDLIDKEIGEFSKRVKVTAARIPKPPYKLKVDIGDSELRLTWEYEKLPKRFEYTAVGFNVYRREEDEKEFKKINKVLLLWQEAGTFYKDFDVINGRKYQYYVTAVDLIGKESKPSDYTDFVQPKDLTPPLIPEGVVIKPEKDKILIAWRMNLELDLAGYNIYRGEGLQEEFNKINKELIPGDFPYYEDKDIKPGKTYFYKISAQDTSGNESHLTAGYSGMVEDITPPQPPKDLKFEYLQKEHIVHLSWAAPKEDEEDLLGFNLFRGVTTATAMRINKKPVKETIYKDEAYHHRWIIPGKSYLWGVSSVDKSYNESQKVWIKGYIPDDEPPLTPKSIYARSQEDGSIKITWQICLSWDAAGYKLYRGQDTQKAPILLKEFATQTLSYIDKDINKGTRYFYYVSAVDKAGNESKPSDKVYVVAADIHSPPAPENLKAIYIEKKRYVLITWDKLKEIDDLAGYNVYYCHLPTGMYKQLNKELIKEEKFIHKECKQEGLYYKVRAMDTSGNLSRYSKFTQAIKKEE